MRLLLFTSVVLAAAGCQTDADGLTAASSSAAENPLASPTTYVEVDSPDALLEAVAAVDAEIVLVNYWATWCSPCRVEFPDLVRYDAENTDGVEVRFVSMDLPADAELVQDFLDEQGATEPSFLYTGPGEVISQIDMYAANVLPVTMAFDDDGVLLKSHAGMMTYDQIGAFVADAKAL